jgi:hypothetical protein
MSHRGTLLTLSLLAVVGCVATALADGADTTLTVVNDSGRPIEMFWVDEDGEANPVGVQPPGTTLAFDTGMGREWVVRTTGPEPTEILRFRIRTAPQTVTLARPVPSEPAREPEVEPEARAVPESKPPPESAPAPRTPAEPEPDSPPAPPHKEGRPNEDGPAPPPPPKGRPDDDAPPAPKTRPRPEPQRKTITVTASVEAVGGWTHVSGDTEMDTDWRDRVPVEIKSRLFHSKDAVRIHVYFSCREYRGDGTAYAGPRRTLDLATRANGKIEAGWRVVSIDARGGPGAAFNPVSVGRQHGFQPVDTTGTFWDALSYRVDGRGGADGAVVGFRGRLSVRVVLER